MVAVAVLYEAKDCREGHLKEKTCRTMLVSQNIQDEPFRITSDDAIIDMEENTTLGLYNIPSNRLH